MLLRIKRSIRGKKVQEPSHGRQMIMRLKRAMPFGKHIGELLADIHTIRTHGKETDGPRIPRR